MTICNIFNKVFTSKLLALKRIDLIVTESSDLKSHSTRFEAQPASPLLRLLLDQAFSSSARVVAHRTLRRGASGNCAHAACWLIGPLSWSVLSPHPMTRAHAGFEFKDKALVGMKDDFESTYL